MNIFGITFVRMTSKQIAEEQQEYRKTHNGDFMRRYQPLPPFTIKEKEKGDEFIIVDSAGYFQFVYDPDIIDEDDNESYVLFDLTMSDSILEEEISMTSVEDFLKEIGFLDLYKKYHDKFLIHDYNAKYTILNEQCFVVKIESYKSWTDYGCEYDYNIDIVGYLNNNMELIK